MWYDAIIAARMAPTFTHRGMVAQFIAKNRMMPAPIMMAPKMAMNGTSLLPASPCFTLPAPYISRIFLACAAETMPLLCHLGISLRMTALVPGSLGMEDDSISILYKCYSANCQHQDMGCFFVLSSLRWCRATFKYKMPYSMHCGTSINPLPESHSSFPFL